MAVRVEPYAASRRAAVRAFNARLTAADAVPGFLLGEDGPASTNGGPVVKDRFLAVEDDAVRGGFMLQRQPFWIGGTVRSVANYQAPISEGIADRRYNHVGPYMLKAALREHPLMFCLGMGGAHLPLPRLLAATGWTLRTVPFLVHVRRARRVLRELPMARATRRRRLVAAALRVTGSGGLIVGALQRRARLIAPTARRLAVESVREWGGWVDALWESARGECAMAAVRDRAGVAALYPPADPRNLCVRMSDDGLVVGWAVLYDTAMHGHQHFGDLRVGTVLDAWARPGYADAVARAATACLAGRGVDLVVTNQAHEAWVTAFRRAGYLDAPSNYVLALSRPLADAVRAQPQGEARIHATRGDADGRIHL